jgi:hypothetical protein
MINPEAAWPPALPPDAVCFTVDVEWADRAVLDDLCGLFDAHGVRATFFVTHDGVQVPGHERGLHPNFLRSGDSYRRFLQARGADASEPSDGDVQRAIITMTHGFASEAKGVRSHALYYVATLLPLYRAQGLEYECSYQLPLVSGLRPFWKEHDIVALPTYYADHFDLMGGVTGFDVGALHLERPGLKIFDFHPNMVFLNACSTAHYDSTKAFYQDPERLLAARHPGRGVRTLLVDLLSSVAERRLQTLTTGEVNTHWRTVPKWA